MSSDQVIMDRLVDMEKEILALKGGLRFAMEGMENALIDAESFRSILTRTIAYIDELKLLTDYAG